MKNKKNNKIELFARPALFPDWALTDTVDPVYLSPNVLEPTAEKKQYGWKPNDVAINNQINWLHRLTNDWLKYIDQQIPNSPVLFSSRPSPAVAGKVIYISDLGDGGTMAFSDGVNWRKISDNSIITE